MQRYPSVRALLSALVILLLVAGCSDPDTSGSGDRPGVWNESRWNETAW